MILLPNIDQAFVRQYNIEHILTILQRYQPITRTDIAKLTEISPTSITRMTGTLMALGLVEEVSVSNSQGRGRRAVNLHTCHDGVYTLGFHIDNQAMRMCLLDFGNTPCFTRTFGLNRMSKNPNNLAEFAFQCYSSLRSEMPKTADRLRAIGVSVSGRIEPFTGIISRSESLNWTQVDLGRAFAERFGMPTHVENDVKACLTWERVNRMMRQQDIAYLYIGNMGLGFAHISNDQMVRGKNGSAGEIESIPLSGSAKLEELLMEKNVLARARACDPSVNSLQDILTAYRLRLTWARLLIDDFMRNLNLLLQLIRCILDPHLIILGGDMLEMLFDLPELTPQAPFICGQNFETACANGAAVVAMEQAVREMIGSHTEE